MGQGTVAWMLVAQGGPLQKTLVCTVMNFGFQKTRNFLTRQMKSRCPIWIVTHKDSQHKLTNNRVCQLSASNGIYIYMCIDKGKGVP